MLEEIFFTFMAFLVLLCAIIFVRNKYARICGGILICLLIPFMWQGVILMVHPWHYFKESTEKIKYYNEIYSVWEHCPFLDIKDINDDIKDMTVEELIAYLGEPSNTDYRDKLCIWLDDDRRGTLEDLYNYKNNPRPCSLLNGCYYIFPRSYCCRSRKLNAGKVWDLNYPYICRFPNE